MFAFLAPFFSKFGGYFIVILLVLGLAAGGYAVYENQKAQIATLTSNVQTLQTSNDALNNQVKDLLKDMATVKAAQDQANAAIQNATAQFSSVQNKIKNSNLTKAVTTNSAAAEVQINTDFNNLFGAVAGDTK